MGIALMTFASAYKKLIDRCISICTVSRAFATDALFYVRWSSADCLYDRRGKTTSRFITTGTAIDYVEPTREAHPLLLALALSAATISRQSWTPTRLEPPAYAGRPPPLDLAGLPFERSGSSSRLYGPSAALKRSWFPRTGLASPLKSPSKGYNLAGALAPWV